MFKQDSVVKFRDRPTWQNMKNNIQTSELKKKHNIYLLGYRNCNNNYMSYFMSCLAQI